MPTVFEDGPYLVAAVLCERAIQENDGVLSLVRLVDKVIVQFLTLPEAPEPTELPTALVSLQLAVAIKAGTARGNYNLAIAPQDPAGARLPAQEIPVDLTAVTDDGSGANVIVNMNLGVRLDGLYWFDVLIDGQLVTRVPLRIELQQADIQQPPVQQAPETSG